MKILPVERIRELDAYTIEHEPIHSVDLMERASRVFAEWFMEHFAPRKPVFIFAGPGNNGGDGLAIARILEQNNFDVRVYLVTDHHIMSDDAIQNLERLEKMVDVYRITQPVKIPTIPSGSYVIDALFGSGLNRPPEGLFLEVIKKINEVHTITIAVDIPSGVMADKPTISNAIQADYTLTFQVPKLSFFTPEGGDFVGQLVVLDIKLSKEYLENFQAEYYYTEATEMKLLVRKRNKYAHKGIFGHVLMVGGQTGMAGSIMLGSKSCLRSGAGLVTMFIPSDLTPIAQTFIPEAMVISGEREQYLTSYPKLEYAFDAIGLGPGLGTRVESKDFMHQLLEQTEKPMVIDADALNMMAIYPELLELLPENSILTPHPGEFKRLAGDYADGFEAFEKAKVFAEKYSCIIVLKGANTAIINPEKEIFFNSSGNPGMATAGSGDVLTGIIAGLLAQGYKSEDAARLGVYLHGLAGDFAAKNRGYQSLIASDIIENLGRAYQALN